MTSRRKTVVSVSELGRWNRAERVAKFRGQAGKAVETRGQAGKEVETRGRGGRVVEPHGVWIYAIAEPVKVTALGQLTGVGGGPIRTVAAAGLTAVAENVDLAEFGEEALRRNLEDLDWLEAAARAHHRVIDAVGQQGSLVPMRLATVYSGDASIAAMLADREADFRTALRRISGRQEWGVKAYAAGRPATGSDTPATVGSSSPGTGAGAAYLQRRRAQLAAQKDTRRESLASADIIHAELSRYAAATRLHPPQSPQLTGSKVLMVLNAAYLLDDERAEDFAAAVAALARQYPSVRLELTGPWPPYSFTGNPETED